MSRWASLPRTSPASDGAIFQMLSHGFVSGALFLLVGVIYDRMHTREIGAYGGLANRMPIYALIFMFFTMANVGLPGTSGFVGEFLTLLGTFRVNTWVALVATSGVILSAAYALWLYRRITLGALVRESLAGITEMTPRERWIFVPLIAMTLLLGVYPRAVTDLTGPSVAALLNDYHASLPAVADPKPPRPWQATKGTRMTSLDLSTILPEAALALFALAALMFGAFTGKDEQSRTILWLTVAALLVAALFVARRTLPEGDAFFGMFRDDAFARFAKVVILISAAAVSGDERRLPASHQPAALRTADPDRAGGRRHDDHGVRVATC